ncbi:T9SS type A sorting domain-containing protein [bacterium]|nr:T9SS type A sorting domain-containing protein [bacterium]
MVMSPAGVNPILHSDVITSINNGLLTVKGITNGDQVEVYSLNGTVLYSRKVDADMLSVMLAAKGLYIVKVNAQSIKVMYY